MFKNSIFARHKAFLSCIWWQKKASKTHWATTLGMNVILAERKVIEQIWKYVIDLDFSFTRIIISLGQVILEMCTSKKSYRAGTGITFYGVETSTSHRCVAFNLLGNKIINIAFFEEVTAVCFIVQYYHNVPTLHLCYSS